MAVLYHIWVPAVALAHALGLALLLYSLEKVSGVVSKNWRRFTTRDKASGRQWKAEHTDSNTAGGHGGLQRGDSVKVVAEAQVAQSSNWPPVSSIRLLDLLLVYIPGL